MIFFIIASGNRKTETNTGDYSSITASAPVKKPEIGTPVDLISWNEVPEYSDLAKLTFAVLAEAQKDWVCKDICKQALDQYGIDPFLTQCDGINLKKETMKTIRDKIFFQWAHPMIGNIGNSPQVRPQLYCYQYYKNWDNCACIDEFTKKKINDLYKTLDPMNRSARDQVRICYSITELTRAIIGEITSVSSRRLDKIFALQLCKSKTLKAQQIELITRIITKISTTLKQNFSSSEKSGFKCTEYLKYFMPDVLKLKIDAQWYLYEQLINIATGDQYKITSKYTPTVEENTIINAVTDNVWKKFPDPIKCAILINSFRRIVGVIEGPKKYSMGIKDPIKITNFFVPYKLCEAASNSHVPAIFFVAKSKRSLTHSWNRDEYHLGTITYRHYLMHLWGGPSGHGTGNVAFVKKELGADLKPEEPNIILTGLFAFWRLYYDKRISVVHTLAETMEGSLSFSGYTETSKIAVLSKIPDVTDDDAYEITEKCSLNGKPENYNFVDPIKIMRTLKKEYYKFEAGKVSHEVAFTNLQEQCDGLRTELTGADYNYHVPQWTKDLSDKTGMSVQSFAYSETNTRDTLARTLLECAGANANLSMLMRMLC